MLDVTHHTPQQLEEVLPYRTTKEEPLHEISTATIDCLKVGDALLRNPEAIKVNVRSSNTPEVRRVKVIGLGLVKSSKEGSSLTHRVRNGSRTTANLKPRG